MGLQEAADHLKLSSEHMLKAAEELAAGTLPPPEPDPEPDPDPGPDPGPDPEPGPDDSKLIFRETFSSLPPLSSEDYSAQRSAWLTARDWGGWALDTPTPHRDYVTVDSEGLTLRMSSDQPWGTPLSPDNPPLDRKRSAIRLHWAGDSTKFSREPRGVRRLYSTRIQVPADWQNVTWFNCMQFHGDGYSPPIWLNLWGENAYLNWKPLDDSLSQPWKRPMSEVIGSEIHIVVESRWGRVSDGEEPYTKIWINDEQILDYSSDNVLDGKLGPYWSPVEMYHHFNKDKDFELKWDNHLICTEVAVGREDAEFEDM